MSKLYKLSGLLTLALPLAALADSNTTVSPAQRAEAMRQMRMQQAKAMRAADAAYRAAARGRRFTPPAQPKILTNVTVAGRVLDENGKPAPNTAVYVYWTTHQNIEKSVVLTTDAQGKFSRQMEIKSRSNSLQICAVAAGKSCAAKRLFLTTQPLAAAEIRLPSGIALSGRLLASDGSPLANQTLSLRSIVNIDDNNMHFSSHFGQQMALQGGQGESVLPAAVSAKLFRTRTDAAGRFTFTGLPRRSVAQIALDKPLILTQSSLLPISIADTAQEAGTLIAVRPGSVIVRMTDPLTGKPVANTQIQLTSADFSMAAMQMTNRMGRGEANPSKHTNADGVATFANLRPGSYYASTEGRFEKVTIEEGKPAPTVTLALRQDKLKGRIVDTKGKPIAGLEVKMNPLIKHDEEIMRVSPFARFGEFGWENRPRATTDANGYFTLPKLAWSGDQLTIRAVRGNALAEWNGSPAQIRGELTLKMQPNALITVTGRLIDTQRRPLKNTGFQSLHWTAAPRSFWVSNARAVQLDAKGRFQLDGMKRGESFSFITGTRFGGFQPGIGRTQQNGAKSVAFESPRFATLQNGQQQDLGDVMIHPLDDPEELEENYGFNSSQSVAKFPGLLPAPSQDAVREAKAALLAYRNLLQAGDMKQVYAMTSRLTPGWSEDYKTYLQRAILRDGYAEISPKLEKSAALRYVPRSVAASFVNGNNGMMFGVPQDITPIVKELNRSGEWVFLVEEQNGGVVTTGIVRKEEGQWRVINNHFASFFGGDPLQQIASNGVQPSGSDFSKPASAAKPESLDAARSVAERYLQEWAAGRPSALRTLTSVFSSLASAKPDDFARAFEKRIDGGACPLGMNEPFALEPLSDLSLWEQQWMASLTLTPQVQSRMRIFQNGGIAPTPQGQHNGNFPSDYARRGDLALFRYSAQGRAYIISLVRSDNKWSVLEPAFIQSEAVSRDIVMR